EGELTAQLKSRHWVITDGNGKVEEVRGPGVVGQQPLLRPGEHFEYTSGCVLETPRGTMEGSYQMRCPDGRTFDARIGAFDLALPFSLNWPEPRATGPARRRRARRCAGERRRPPSSPSIWCCRSRST